MEKINRSLFFSKWGINKRHTRTTVSFFRRKNQLFRRSSVSRTSRWGIFLRRHFFRSFLFSILQILPRSPRMKIFVFFFEVGNQKFYEDSRTLTFSHPMYRSSEEKRPAHLSQAATRKIGNKEESQSTDLSQGSRPLSVCHLELRSWFFEHKTGFRDDFWAKPTRAIDSEHREKGPCQFTAY